MSKFTPAVQVSSDSASGDSSDNNSTAKNKPKNRYIRTYDDPNQLTPYQGTRRTFGFFYCLTCETEWASANTWANKGQDCFTCLKNTYPYRQLKLERGAKKNNDKPHPKEHCEMCNYLKEVCTMKFMIDQKKMAMGKAGEISREKSDSGNEKKAAKKKRQRRTRGNGSKKAAPTPNEE